MKIARFDKTSGAPKAATLRSTNQFSPMPMSRIIHQINNGTRTHPTTIALQSTQWRDDFRTASGTNHLQRPLWFQLHRLAVHTERALAGFEHPQDAPSIVAVRFGSAAGLDTFHKMPHSKSRGSSEGNSTD